MNPLFELALCAWSYSVIASVIVQAVCLAALVGVCLWVAGRQIVDDLRPRWRRLRSRLP